MIADVDRQIDLARRSGLTLRTARWALNFLKSETIFKQRPYAVLRVPRSRRDKDMSDNQAIKKTIKVYKQKGILHFTPQAGILFSLQY